MENEPEIDIAKRFDKLEQLIDNLAQSSARRFDELEGRIDGLATSCAKQFAAIDARFDKVEVRLERVEGKIDGITRRIDHEVDERTQLSERVSKLEEAAHA